MEGGDPDLGGKVVGRPDLDGMDERKADLRGKVWGLPGLGGKVTGRSDCTLPSLRFPQGFSFHGEHILRQLRGAETWH